MADIEVLRDRTGEFMVAQAEGQTEEGIDFLDAWYPPHVNRMFVVDAGRIVVPEDGMDDLVAQARKRGLTVEGW